MGGDLARNVQSRFEILSRVKVLSLSASSEPLNREHRESERNILQAFGSGTRDESETGGLAIADVNDHRLRSRQIRPDSEAL